MLTDRWTSKSPHGHTHKANTPSKKKKWAKIAEGLRKKGMEEGEGYKNAPMPPLAIGSGTATSSSAASSTTGSTAGPKNSTLRAGGRLLRDRGRRRGHGRCRQEGDRRSRWGARSARSATGAAWCTAKPAKPAVATAGSTTRRSCGGRALAGGGSSSGGGGGKKDALDAFRPEHPSKHRPGEAGEEKIEPVVPDSKTKIKRIIKGGHSDDSDYRAPFTDAVYDREFSAEARKEAAGKRPCAARRRASRSGTRRT